MRNPGLIRLDERIPALDILRGLALLGILLYNVQGYAYPLLYVEQLGRRIFEVGVEGRILDIILFFVQGKFYTMFSFLFGYSFILWLGRAEERYGRAGNIHFRRMLGLLGFGLIHALLFWWGDILVTYALCGMILYLFRNVSAKGLVKWAAGILAAYAGWFTLIYAVFMASMPMDPAGWQAEAAAWKSELEAGVQRAIEAYGSGSWTELMAQRLADARLMAESLPYSVMLVLPMFLLGAAAAKSGWLVRISRGGRAARMEAAGLFAAGMALTLLKEWGLAVMDPMLPSPASIVYIIGSAFGDPVLSLSYTAAVAMFCGNPERAARLSWFGCMGKLSLSNYLAESVISTTLFYSYGLGWYGKPVLGELLAIAAGVYLALMLASRYWIARFGSGPAERLLRRITYGRKRRHQTV